MNVGAGSGRTLKIAKSSHFCSALTPLWAQGEAALTVETSTGVA